MKDLRIIHTDLKPDNIMLANTEDMTIKIIDFGLARCHSEVKTGMILQALGYRYYCFHTWGLLLFVGVFFTFPLAY